MHWDFFFLTKWALQPAAVCVILLVITLTSRVWRRKQGKATATAIRSELV